MVSENKINVFVNGKNIYNVNLLIELSKDLPVYRFDLSSISLDDTKFITWKLNNVRDIIVHYKRIEEADLSNPISVRQDDIVIDGRHRVIKALAEKRKWLPARKITKKIMDLTIIQKRSKGMAIRIRKVDGHTIALCAACTEPKEGDLYLDDNIHHALSTKFGLDWYEEGQLDDPLVDEVLVPLMKAEGDTLGKFDDLGLPFREDIK